MSRWPRGEAQIEQLIANKQLQQVIGGIGFDHGFSISYRREWMGVEPTSDRQATRHRF